MEGAGDDRGEMADANNAREALWFLLDAKTEAMKFSERKLLRDALY